MKRLLGKGSTSVVILHSLLSNGPLGWTQIANFIVTGLLVVAAATGMRRALSAGKGRTWGAVLLGIFGSGQIGAGIFVEDPSFGFPPGTPVGPANPISVHGLLHSVFAGMGFVALILACFVMARRFNTPSERAWKWFSWLTGIIFLVGFFGVAAGSGNSLTVIEFWIAITFAFAWISAVSVKLTDELGRVALS